MKKLLTLILAMLMLLSVAACNAETPPDGTTNRPTQSQDYTNSPTQNPDDDNNGGNEKNEITFNGLVAVDNAECTIKVTKIDPDNLWGYTLKLQLENKSANKTYMFSLQNAAINGVQCSSLFASEVAAGKKSNDEIHFTKRDLEENGIKDYTDIELTFRVYDSNDWLADDVAKETVHIYPYGEDKATNFVRTPQPTDNVIVDNEYVTVIVTGYKNDAIWGYTVKLFLLNKTDKTVMFSVNDASVNGFMADTLFAKSVSPKKCAFDSMSWSDKTLKENGITSVNEIEFNLRAYDIEDWLGDNFVNQTVTLKP